MTKINRKSVKGELYDGKKFVGSILKVDGGYQIWNVEYGYGEPIMNGQVFKGSDFSAVGILDLGYGVVKKYELVAA